jgi:hypothetical protein
MDAHTPAVLGGLWVPVIAWLSRADLGVRLAVGVSVGQWAGRLGRLGQRHKARPGRGGAALVAYRALLAIHFQVVPG